jgi:hypothetical protein
MQAIYTKLGLGAFESYLPRLTTYWEGVADYTANRYDLDASVRHRIAQRWGPYLEQYGYSV